MWLAGKRERERERERERDHVASSTCEAVGSFAGMARS